MIAGVARGCGWQKIGACINLGAYYVAGIPCAYLIAFVLRVGGMVSGHLFSLISDKVSVSVVVGSSWVLADIVHCIAWRTGPVVGHHLWPLGASPAANGRHAMHQLGQ